MELCRGGIEVLGQGWRVVSSTRTNGESRSKGKTPVEGRTRRVCCKVTVCQKGVGLRSVGRDSEEKVLRSWDRLLLRSESCILRGMEGCGSLNLFVTGSKVVEFRSGDATTGVRGNSRTDSFASRRSSSMTNKVGFEPRPTYPGTWRKGSSRKSFERQRLVKRRETLYVGDNGSWQRSSWVLGR